MTPTAQFIRQRIEFENNLVNQRIGALVSSQAFLVSAFTIGLSAPLQFRSGSFDAIHRLLIRLLPVAGISIVVLMSLSIIAAIISLHTLHQQAAKHRAPEDPPLHSHLLLRWMGYSASLGIPAVFLVLWSVIIITSNTQPS